MTVFTIFTLVVAITAIGLFVAISLIVNTRESIETVETKDII